MSILPEEIADNFVEALVEYGNALPKDVCSMQRAMNRMISSHVDIMRLSLSRILNDDEISICIGEMK